MENNLQFISKNFSNQDKPEIINQRRLSLPFPLFESSVQKMQNEINNKLFKLSIKIENNIELDNNMNIKNELKNFQNKILATSIIDKSSDLYIKILKLNKNEQNKVKNVVKKDIKSNQINKENQVDDENKNQNKSYRKYNRKEKKYRVLIKKFNIYDSMDDEELTDNTEFSGNSLSPKGFFILIYDILLTILVFSQLFAMPITLAFCKDFCFDRAFVKIFIRHFIDFIYFFDIFISFFRGYYNNEFQIILNNKKIIFNYFETDFFDDLIEVIPYFYINDIICKNRKNKHLSKFSLSTKEIIIKLCLITKLLKIKKVKNTKKNRALELLYDSLSENYYLENLVNFIFMLIYMIFFIHLIVCVHIFLGGTRYPNWVSEIDTSYNISFSSKYISSLYFMMTTMTSVGYGDIVCISHVERVYQLFLLGVGLVVYTFLITKFGNYINEQNTKKLQLEEKSTILEEIRETYPQMSFKLYTKIREHLRKKYLKKCPSEVNLLINSLPDNLRNKMMFTIYDKIIKNFNIFKNCDNSNFILKILNCFVKMVFIKDTILINEGEIIDNLFFVNEGRLILEAVIDLNDPYKSLQKYMLINFEDISKSNLENFRELSKSSYTENNLSISQDKNMNDYSIFKNKIGMILENANKNDIEKTSQINTDNNNDYSDEAEKFNCSENKIKYTTLFNGNTHPLKILDIRKNESIGMVYMLLEKPSPLSLIVKSSYAEVFLLKKQDAMNIFKAHQNIIKRMRQKSYHNILSIKNLTFKVIKKFCLVNGFDNDFNEFLKKNSTKSFCRSLYSLSRNVTKKNNIVSQKSTDTYKKLNRGKRYSACIFIKKTKKETNNNRKSRNSVNFLQYTQLNLNRSISNDLNKLQSINKIKSIRKPTSKKEKDLNNRIHFSDNEVNNNTKVNNFPNRTKSKFINSKFNKIAVKKKKSYNKLNFDKINIDCKNIDSYNDSMKNILPTIIKEESIINESKIEKEIFDKKDTLDNQSYKTIDKTINCFQDTADENSTEIKIITLNNIKGKFSKKIRKKIEKNTRKKNIKKLWDYMKYIYTNGGLETQRLGNMDNIPEEINQNNELKFNKFDMHNLDQLLDKLLESNSSSESDENDDDYIKNNKTENNVKYKNNYNNKLKCDNNISFNIYSSYKNINKMSKGQIVNNKIFSKNIFKKLKNLIKAKNLKNKVKTTNFSNLTKISRISKKEKTYINNNKDSQNNYSRNYSNPFNLNVEMSSINTKNKEVSEEDSICFENLTQIPLFSEKNPKNIKDNINLKNDIYSSNQEVLKSKNNQSKNYTNMDKNKISRKSNGENTKNKKSSIKSNKKISKTFKSTKKNGTKTEQNNLSYVPEYKDSFIDSKKMSINIRETSQKSMVLGSVNENAISKPIKTCFVNKKNNINEISNVDINLKKNLSINKSKCIIF